MAISAKEVALKIIKDIENQLSEIEDVRDETSEEIKINISINKETLRNIGERSHCRDAYVNEVLSHMENLDCDAEKGSDGGIYISKIKPADPDVYLINELTIGKSQKKQQ